MSEPATDGITAGDTHGSRPGGSRLLALSLTALGIVYGDIGTSPLYALRESFLEEHDVAISPANVIGVLSLIVWALVLVISIKYLVFVMRADNRGEGGILALTSLVTPVARPRGGRRVLVLLGLFATALLYGDGMITPSISVLSAVEGLSIATPLFNPFIIPLTIVILVALFSFQSRGTATVGKVFGPITLVWFLVLAVLGGISIAREPAVLAAVSPHHAVAFFAHNGARGLLVLGSVFLVVTGGEALYADMGHFGPRPIRVAWFALVFPALLLNYLGQGALLIREPAAIANPFFHLAPAWALIPLVVLATAATVIASQALISGAFSLTMQAVQLGYLPRLPIEHTSAEHKGQIYIPAVNWTLMLACVGLVLGFRSSSNLAGAYGVAVTTTMVVTSLLFIVVAHDRWHWHPLSVALVGGGFLLFDTVFFGANLLKIPHGGWFPLLVGFAVFALLTTWKKGRLLLSEHMQKRTLPHDLFLDNMRSSPPHRTRGVAVYMYSNRNGTPPALLHNLKHNGVLHEQLVYLSLVTEDVPFVSAEERAAVEELAPDVHSIVLHYGFLERVDVPEALAAIRIPGLKFELLRTTYFLGRETLIAGSDTGMARWRKHIFRFMARNATDAARYFGLPPNRVVELGAQVEL